jgi:hypothetical protein
MRISMPPGCRTTLAVLLMLTAPTLAARASDHDPDHFPMQVHVFERSAHHVRRYGGYRGEGKANLIEADQINGIQFTYDCAYKFHSSDADEYYPARWKHPGESLDILMGEIGSETRTHTCELKVAIKDRVYRKVAGNLVTMSPEEYASLEEARAEHDHALAPDDLDPSHYPVQIALLHLAWTGAVGGVHVGTGQGNIISPGGLNAVDFSIHCPVVIQATPEGRYLLGRWLEPGTHLLLLLRSIDVDGEPGATCNLNSVVEPDVYVRSGGNVKAVSQEEYRKKYAASSAPPTP